MALANVAVKHGRTSEMAYLCLKIAWLYRGKRHELVAADEKKKRELYGAEFSVKRMFKMLKTKFENNVLTAFIDGSKMIRTASRS